MTNEYNELGHVDPDYGRLCVPAIQALTRYSLTRCRVYQFVFDKTPGFGGDWQPVDFEALTYAEVEALETLYVELPVADKPDPFKGLARIHKYVLPVMTNPENFVDLKLKGAAYLLKVAQQRENTCAWAVEYPDSAVEQRVRVYWFGTGHPLPPNANAFVHLGTQLYFEDSLVLHFFSEFPVP